MNRKPNIIYILGDDQRSDYMSYGRHEILRTPHLDRLAREGTNFSNAFCTSPVCVPSRTCHYLGQWERKHGINFNSNSSVAPEAWEKSFPMVLKQEGYFTGWIGKNHVPAGKGGFSSSYFEEQFDYWYGIHGHCGFYPKEKGKRGEIFKNAEADTQVEIFTEGTLDFLRPDKRFRDNAQNSFPERPDDQPFCLCVTFNLPHDQSTGTMELRPSDDELYKSVYRDNQHLLCPPETYLSYDKAYENPRLPRSLYNGLRMPHYDYVNLPTTLRERQLRICQTVTGVDRFVGILREELERLGLADNTIIVFSTDHGIHHGEHGLGGKNFLYEEDLRIPAIIYDPRIKQKAETRPREELIVVPDFASTVLDLCDVDIPDSMQGTSLKPLLREGQVEWREDIFTEQLMDIQNYPRSESVRSREWKYIRYFQRTEDPKQAGNFYRGTLDNYNDCLTSSLNGEQPVYEELFNLKEDPLEVKNLAESKSCEEQLNAMRARLSELAREVKEDDNPPLTLPAS